MLLKLAETVLDRQVIYGDDAEGPTPPVRPAPAGPYRSPEISALFLELLRRADKTDAAVEFACGPRFVGLDDDRLAAVLAMYRAAGRTAASNALGRYIWEKDADNWDAMEAFFETSRRLIKDGMGAGDSTVAPLVLRRRGAEPEDVTLPAPCKSAAEVVAVIDALVAKHPRQRGPLLARLEWAHSETSEGSPARVAALAPLLQRFADQFADKPSCFLDMVKYLRACGDGFAVYPAQAAADAPPDAQHWARERSRLVLRSYYAGHGSPMAPAEAAAFVAECRDTFAKAAAAASDVEENSWDMILAAACTVCARLHDTDMNTGPGFWLRLGWACVHDAADAYATTPSLLLWHALFGSASESARLTLPRVVKLIDCKSVQHDTMLPLSLLQYLRVHAWDEAGQMAWNGDQWFNAFPRDSANNMKKAFDHLTWSRVKGLQRVEDRVVRSVAKATVFGTHALLFATQTQTRSELVEALRKARGHLQEAITAGDDAAAAVDSTDLASVAAAAVHELPNSKEALALMETMLPSVRSAAATARRTALVLLAVREVLRVEARRAAEQKVKTMAGGGKKKKHVDPSAPTADDLMPVYGDDACSCKALGEKMLGTIAADTPAAETLLVKFLAAVVDACGAETGKEAAPVGTATTAFTAWLESQQANIDAIRNDGAALDAVWWPWWPLVIVVLRALWTKGPWGVAVKAWCGRLLPVLESLRTAIQSAAISPLFVGEAETALAEVALSGADFLGKASAAATAATERRRQRLAEAMKTASVDVAAMQRVKP